MGSNGGRQPHVALFAFPFASHPGNLLTFAHMLAAAAPDAAFSFFTSAPSLASLSRSPSPDNIRLFPLDDGCPDPPPANVAERLGLFIRAMPGNMRAGVGEAERETGGLKVSCVVSDGFLAAGGEVAEEMGVPWVPLWTCGPAALLAHLHTDQLRRRIGVLDPADEASAAKLNEHPHFIPSLSALRVRDLPSVVLLDVHSDFAGLLHRAGNKLPSAAAIALNTFEGLSPDVDAEFTSIFARSLPIGPFHLLRRPPPCDKPEARECLAWLDRHAPGTVAYVSFGTVTIPPLAEVTEIASGLEASGAPFLWTLKEGARDALPEGFMGRTGGRGLVVEWAPQAEVLGHGAVGAFVTHCGWNSLVEGVASGVPMACRPFFGDQKTNARMVSEAWRTGVAFEGESISRGEMERVLDVMLRGEEGRRMRGRARELKEMAAAAAEPGGRAEQNLRSLLKIVCSV